MDEISTRDVLTAVVPLLSAILGAWLGHWSATLAADREDKRDHARSKQEALAARLRAQTEAIDEFLRLSAKWESAPFVGKFVNGQIAAEHGGLVEDVATARSEAAALGAKVGAAFGQRVGFATQVELGIELLAAARPIHDLAMAAQRLLQRCLDSMNACRSQTEREIGLPPMLEPEALLDKSDKGASTVVLIEKLLVKTAKDQDEVELRRKLFQALTVVWHTPSATPLSTKSGEPIGEGAQKS